MRVKQFLAQLETLFPFLYNNLLSAIRPILSINKCQINMQMLCEYALKRLNESPNLCDELLKPKVILPVTENDKKCTKKLLNFY